MAPRPSVLVRRVGDRWRAEAGAPGQWIQARNLPGLFNQLRLLIDLDASRLVFHTGDAELDALLAEIRTAWRRADTARRTAQALADRLLSRADGLSNRDIAVLIGKSHQRVAQLRQRRRHHPGGGDPPGGPGCLPVLVHPPEGGVSIQDLAASGRQPPRQ
jgi:hypothetical protein